MTNAPQDGRVALITGGTRGIGAATARLLASRGMRVVVNYRSSRDEADGVVASITSTGGRAIAVQADVRDESEVHAMVDQIGADLGEVEVLVHNALIPYAVKSFADISWDELGAKLDQEMRAAFLITKAVASGMTKLGYGRIVYLDTVLSRQPRAGMIALGTAKAALGQFARYVAQELGPHGITVNLISPGPVSETRTADAVLDPEQQQRQAAQTALGRIATPDDVARAIAFYVGDDSAFITGTTAPVNGGLAMDYGGSGSDVHTIDLTYVGLGIHEELVAYIADQENYYEQEDVHVAVRDGVSWDDERVRRTATIGLGRALLSRLTHGVPWTVLCVNTQRPLFWLVGRYEYSCVEDLKGGRVAIHPPRSAPGCFSRIVLRKHGLDPDHDLVSVVMTPGDYGRHLRMLVNGDLDAAFIGSTLAPEVIAEENNLRLLAFVGEEFMIPTVGVAVDPTHLAPDDPAVQALVRANRRALRTIHDDPELATRYVNALMPSLRHAQARRHYERYVAPDFTVDGRHDPSVAAQAVASVCEELGVAGVPDAGEIYRTDPAER